MRMYRGNAIAVGALLPTCTVSSILSAAPLGATLDEPDYLTQLAGSANSAVLTAHIIVKGFTPVNVDADDQGMGPATPRKVLP